jgi:heme A synthase
VQPLTEGDHHNMEEALAEPQDEISVSLVHLSTVIVFFHRILTYSLALLFLSLIHILRNNQVKSSLISASIHINMVLILLTLIINQVCLV